MNQETDEPRLASCAEIFRSEQRDECSTASHLLHKAEKIIQFQDVQSFIENFTSRTSGYQPEKHDGKKHVIIVGVTGSGKSTLTNCLAGCKLRTIDPKKAEELGISPESLVVVPESEGGTCDEVAPIGQAFNRSETKILKPVELGDMIVWDAPGFEDCQGPEDNIVNAVNLYRLLHGAQSGGFVMVVLLDAPSLGAMRGSLLVSTMNILLQLFGNRRNKLEEHLDKIVFLVSKASMKLPINTLQRWITTAACEKGLNINLSGGTCKVQIFDPTGSHPEHLPTEQLVALIKGTQLIKAEENLFSISLNDSDIRFLERMFEIIAEKIKYLLDEGNFKQVQDDFAIFSSMMVIPNAIVTSNIKTIKDSILDKLRTWFQQIQVQKFDYSISGRSTIKILLDKLERSKILQPLLETNTEKYHTLACKDIKDAESKHQRDEDMELTDSFHKNLQAIQRALETGCQSDPGFLDNLFGLDKAIPYHKATIGRFSLQSSVEIKKMCLFFKKADLLCRSRQSHLRFVFGDQGDLKALIDNMIEMAENYFQQTVDRHLQQRFNECLRSLKQDADSFDIEKVAVLTDRVLDVKDIPLLSSHGFNPALCSDIDVLMRNIERFCSVRLEDEKKRFMVTSTTIHCSACCRFAEKVASERKRVLLSFERQIVISEAALQIVKGEIKLEKQFAAQFTGIEVDKYHRIKSFKSYPAILKIVQDIEASEAVTFGRLRAESEQWVQNFATTNLLESRICVSKMEKAAPEVIEQFTERLIERSLRIDDISDLHTYGFDPELCKELGRLIVSLNDHAAANVKAAEQYKELKSLLDNFFPRLHRLACVNFAERVTIARKEFYFSLEKKIDMAVNATLIVEGKVSVAEHLRLRLVGTVHSAHWRKMENIASSIEDVARVLHRAQCEERCFLDRMKATAENWVEEAKKAKEEEHRVNLIMEINQLVDQGEIERDCEKLVAALDDLKIRSKDKIADYDTCVKNLRKHLASLQDADQINMLLVTQNYNGLIDRYRMLNEVVSRMKFHLELNVEEIRKAAYEKCQEVVRNAREEIKRSVSHPCFLSQTALRTCYGILCTVESTFKLESLRKELLDDVTETVGNLVEGVVAEIRKTADLSRASLELIPKLLIKGYGMCAESNFNAQFTSWVREKLLASLDSKQKYEVGISLMSFTNFSSDGSFESNMSTDASELARAILETFPEFQIFGIEIFNSKSGIIKFEDAVKNLKFVPENKIATNVELAYHAYEKVYSAQVNLIVHDIKKFEDVHSPDNCKKIADISDELKPSAFCLSKKCVKLGELLGLICSEWTFLSARKCPNGLETKYVLQPHCVQILGILRLLAVDEDNLTNNLIQINTGEGKSIAIGFTAIVLAKLGFKVCVVCYSSYLSMRDHKAFAELFKRLEENMNISYSDFDSLANSLICEDGVFPSSREIFLSFLRNQPYTAARAASRPSILLLDEVDVFFSDTFFGNTLNPIVDIPDDESFLILDYVWNNRISLVKDINAVEEILKLRHCVLLLKKYPNLEPFLRLELNKMLSDLRKFVKSPNPQLREINPMAVIDSRNEKIGYEMSKTGVPSFIISYGYETVFSYFLLVDQKIFRDNVKKGMRIACPCGKLLYSEIPRNFRLCLGMTGTLECLSKGQNILIESYNFKRKTFLPSTYEKKPLDRRDTVVVEGVGEKAWDEYFRIILDEVVTELKKGRAILIIFSDYSKLDRFAKAIKITYPKNVAEYKPPQELTDKLHASDRDAVIVKSIRKYMITLMTRSYGRGTDFVCRDQGLVASGGVHIIITFVPDHKSEEKQIMGRTCRQDDPGSARIILLLEDLAHLGASDSGRTQIASKLGRTESEYGWDEYLAHLQNEKESLNFEAMQKHEQNLRKLHDTTISACDAARKGKMKEAGPLFVQVSKDGSGGGCRLMCLSDATGSMESLWQSSKKHIESMLLRIEELAGAGRVELKWVAYRDYDMSASGGLLQCSEWTTSSAVLLSFLKGVACEGGGDFEEAVEAALALANRDAVRPTRVLLIGDAPPHFEKAGQRLTKHSHVLETDWKQECEKLSRNGVPLYTFQVSKRPLPQAYRIAAST